MNQNQKFLLINSDGTKEVVEAAFPKVDLDDIHPIACTSAIPLYDDRSSRIKNLKKTFSQKMLNQIENRLEEQFGNFIIGSNLLFYGGQTNRNRRIYTRPISIPKCTITPQGTFTTTHFISNNNSLKFS